MNNEIGDRTKGKKYPVSIGTAVALECFFGVTEDIPLPPGASTRHMDYQCIVANLRTMARNFISSYAAKDIPFMNIDDLYADYSNELILINNIVSGESNDRLTISFYNNSYYKLKTHLKRATIKEKYTAKQQLVATIEDKLCNLVHANVRGIKDHIAYEYTNDIIRKGARRNIIITHYPMDLLLTGLNPDLLESHTGKIKKPYQFPSKLKRAGDDVPFNKYTIQLLGDSSGYILSKSSAIRKEVLKICKEQGISPVTPEKRFLKTIKDNASPELLSELTGM